MLQVVSPGLTAGCTSATGSLSVCIYQLDRCEGREDEGQGSSPPNICPAAGSLPEGGSLSKIGEGDIAPKMPQLLTQDIAGLIVGKIILQLFQTHLRERMA